MDPATLAATALTVLTPYLAKAGGAVAGKIGEVLPEQAGKLWTAINAKFAGRPAAEEAVKDLSHDPADEDNQAALRKELRKALSEDAQFMADLGPLLENARKESIQNSVIAGENGTAINVGGDVQGNIVVGSHNTISKPGKRK